MADIRESLLRAFQHAVDNGRAMAVVAAGSPWRCCAAAREKGPMGCTCWVPEFDVPQADPDLDTVVGLILGEVDPPQRPLMCGDCAYRPGSPERAGLEGYEGGPAQLDEWARESRFWCHDGMRQPVAWRHPSGIRIEAPLCGDFQPPIVEGVPYRASGEPGLLCAGWAARRRALAAAHQGDANGSE